MVVSAHRANIANFLGSLPHDATGPLFGERYEVNRAGAGVLRTYKEDDLGYNVGLFVMTQKGLNLGLAFETWMTTVVKVGYTF